VTPRGTDWSLALLVALGVATGLATWFAGSPGTAWVFGAHAMGGTALAIVLVWKLRRVWRRVAGRSRRDARTRASVAALVLVAATLGTGCLWSSGAGAVVAGYNVLNWHVLLGGLLGTAVLSHALLRAKPLRRRDLRDRRQFLSASAAGLGALLLWQVQRPVQRALGLRGADRRFTGSYDAGDDFPATSWVADRPRRLDPDGYRLAVAGRVRTPLSLRHTDLDVGDELVATLDCTGGFWTTQRWHGSTVGSTPPASRPTPACAGHLAHRIPLELLARRRPRAAARHKRAGRAARPRPRRPVPAGRPGAARLSVGQVGGAARGPRGPGPGAVASTVWSSFTDAGRGRA
jgi:hypothetical protein